MNFARSLLDRNRQFTLIAREMEGRYGLRAYVSKNSCCSS